MNSSDALRLQRAAATLERRRLLGKGLPAVWFVTDPARTPDPVAVARRLPRGSGIIYRHFGAPERRVVAHDLAQIAKKQRHLLLIGADPALAAEVGAAGVHLPERMVGEARRLTARWPGWWVTAAAHSPLAIRRANTAGADAVLLSTVFPSRSPSAGAPLGVVRLAALARTVDLPVFALGGVNATTAPRLLDTQVSGFAAVDAFSS